MEYRLSDEQRRRCLRRWEMQHDDAPVLVEAEWGWIVGTWDGEPLRFVAEAVTVRHPNCSGWRGRLLTTPPREVWVLVMGGLWLALMVLLPQWGVLICFLLAVAAGLAAVTSITVVRDRRLRSFSTCSEHGGHVLQLAARCASLPADVSHASLWSAAVDPEVAAVLAHSCELPSYDETPRVAEGGYELYPPPAAEQDRLT